MLVMFSSLFESNPALLWFCFIRSVIGLKISRHLHNQSDAKPNPIAIWSRTFSRAWRRLSVFAMNPHWFIDGCIRLLAIVIALVLVNDTQLPVPKFINGLGPSLYIVQIASY